ncbi:glycosyltransferase family 2 protein [Patescibacteria group bacterium]|nr:glycosyltransferase family 2 protein [Patescibacteria group bacterium]MBU1663697.1 glycosyltransferase family 2 protein [Patescibacteria group bacterium]MBU2233349.1 glycosyltransferase family 2 protein [Patescibacteria group bacterium]MBU2264160.1 glycosyltransferase family 2 protein [Patescibacteria group bacterium]
MGVSIIIVNYKSKDLTLNCIRSIRQADWPGLDYEIIVVDNYSGDLKADDLKQFGEIKFIMNSQTIGLGAANNKGAKIAQGKYIVIINPDTLIGKDVFIKLFVYMENHSQVGVVGPKQFNLDNTVQNSCFRWPGLITPLSRRTPLGKISYAKKNLDRFLYKDYNKDRAREVDWLLGSFLFCRASALKQIGLYDEKFFLYFEDTDLCKRFWQGGWKVVYNPEVAIIHNHGRQSARLPWYWFYQNKAAWHHLASWARYLWKWKIN